MKKISLIIINILAVVILLTACNVTETDDTKDIIKPTVEPTAEPTQKPTPKPSPTIEPKDALIGDWKKLNTESIMSISEDGKIYEDQEYIADYEILENGTISFVTSSESILIEYEFDDDGRLIWGTNFECYQAFTRVE